MTNYSNITEITTLGKLESLLQRLPIKYNLSLEKSKRIGYDFLKRIINILFVYYNSEEQY